MASTQTAAPTARTHPALHQPAPTLSSHVKYISAIGAHELRGADAVREYAWTHHRQILRSSRLPASIDKRAAAWKQKRALLRLANAMEAAAAAARNAKAVSLGTFAVDGDLKKSAGFDPSK